MPLTLHYRGATTIPVEIEGLTPDGISDKSLAEIQTLPIFHGNRPLPLAELFDIEGDASDQHLVFTGDLSGVHWIGAHMTTGRIDVQGPAGRHLGSQMRGGEIHVYGSVGNWAAAELRGGRIHVHGHAGDLVGAAYRGATKGMTGGTILIDGNAGHEVGLGMRRGLIAIGGQAGDMLGCQMIAGSVLVMGDAGRSPGAGMRRGTVGIFGTPRSDLLPSFRFTATHRPQILPVLLRELQRQGLPCDPTLLTAEFDFYQGDLVTIGRGEVVFRHPA